MPQPDSDRSHSPRALVRRLDRCVAELNAFLMVLAVGLAILDVTCLTALRFDDAIMNLDKPIVSAVPAANIDDIAR